MRTLCAIETQYVAGGGKLSWHAIAAAFGTWLLEKGLDRTAAAFAEFMKSEGTGQEIRSPEENNVPDSSGSTFSLGDMWMVNPPADDTSYNRR